MSILIVVREERPLKETLVNRVLENPDKIVNLLSPSKETLVNLVLSNAQSPIDVREESPSKEILVI